MDFARLAGIHQFLVDHMTPEERTRTNEFECDICKAAFDSVSELEEHKRDEHQLPSHIRKTENWDIQRDIGEAGLPGAPQV